MHSGGAAIPFIDDANPSPATAWAYRSRARRLRHRFRENLGTLHASLKALAAEVDATGPRRGAALPRAAGSVSGTRQVRARVIEPAAEAHVRPPSCPPTPHASDDAVNGPLGDRLGGVLNAPPAVVDRFAELVRPMLDEGMIRYSRRQALLRRAERLGIGRFEASLVIAAVEHRHRTYAGPAAVRPPVRRRSVGTAVAAVLFLEAAALLALRTVL